MREPLLIIGAMLGFGVAHSLLASRAAKRMAQAAAGQRHARGLYRTAYNVVAAMSLLPALALLATLPDWELYRFSQPLSTIALAIQIVAALGLAYSVRQLDAFHFSGLRQLAAWLAGGEAHSESDTSARALVVGGLHRYVRHPLYTTSLILLWLVSPMTVNRLAFVAAATLYFYVGSIFEERKLVAEFGDAYREYQRRVPRLIPGIRSRFTASS